MSCFSFLILCHFVLLIPKVPAILTNGRNTSALPSGTRYAVGNTTVSPHGHEEPYIASHHRLQGFTDSIVFPKCCPPGQRLDAQLRRCEAASEAASEGSSQPFPAEWLGGSDGGGPRAGCGAGDTLRLGAAEALRRVHLARDGSLRLSVEGAPGQQVHLSREEFCVDALSSEGSPWAMLLCPCGHVICLRKCCPQGHILRVWEVSEAAVETKCYEEPGEKMWAPEFNTTQPGQVHELLVGAWPSECTEGLTRVPPRWSDPKPKKKAIEVQANGTAILGYKIPLLVENFCVDFERNRNGVLSESLLHCASPLEVVLQDAIASAISFLGVLALAMVIATYALLPELRASAFGRSLVCYAACLLLALLVGMWLAVAPDVSNVRCVFILTATQFLHLSAAFWLNVMCFDMGLAFSAFQLSYLRGGTSADKRFIKYSLYAWSGPTILCVIMIAMQLSLPSGHPFRPLEWYMGCKYFTHTANFVFFYGPMVLVVLSNFVLLAYIAWQIRTLQKSRRIIEDNADSCDACPYTGKKKLMLFTRLLWGMGVVETTVEIITWSIGSHMSLWHVTNVVDLSRAFCLFALVCCKQRVWNRLCERLGWSPGGQSGQARQCFNNRVRAGTGATSTAFSTTSTLTISNEGSIFQNSGKVFRFNKISAAGRKRKTENESNILRTKTTPTNANSCEALYSVPTCNSRKARQTLGIFDSPPVKDVRVNSPTKEVDVSSRQVLSGCITKEPEDSLEEGDLSNSASNSPFSKTFPDISKETAERGTSVINQEHTPKKPVRLFSRSSSKVMNNPIFETDPETSKIESNVPDVATDEPPELPEMSVVDDEDDVPIKSWQNGEKEIADNSHPEKRTVSVTSL